MRPHTPSLHTAHAAAPPTSPPETPTTTSPTINRKVLSNGRLPLHAKAHSNKSQPSNIHPLGGTRFSYSRGPRAEEISPRSSHSSDEGTESSAGPPQSPPSDIPELRQERIRRITKIRIEQATFAVEELSDDCSLDSDNNHLDVLRPYAVEYANSDRSRSRSRPPPDMDPALVHGIQNLNAFEDSDVDVDNDDVEFQAQLQHLRKKRRLRRMQSGSLSKRTVSERGSDSDLEDVLPYYEGNDTGPTRRMRRKVDRNSIQYTGQLPERIEELKEPNSDDEIILEDAELLARELPYWTLMDVDSE
ncbi:hypothetical protein F4779DRAFT_231428 [Xylariaceae sp. FL0662B]|nr:hypothetical protein F4779DRAFT_231428 [Xylariaceae sp. FL0662B]